MFLSARQNWNSQRIFHRPAAIQSSRKTLPCMPRHLSPCGKWLCYSLEGNHAISACIAMLFYAGCPPAIAWKISQCIIYAIYRVLFARAFSHISKKILISQPSWTDSNASPAIVAPHARLGISTAAYYVAPAGIGHRPIASPTMAMADKKKSLACIASFCLRDCLTLESAYWHIVDGATGTLACQQSIPMIVAALRVLNHGPFVKLVANVDLKWGTHTATSVRCMIRKVGRRQRSTETAFSGRRPSLRKQMIAQEL